MYEGDCGVGYRNTQVSNTEVPVSLPLNNSNRREIGTMTDSDDRDKTILKLKEEIQRLKSGNKAIKKIFTPNQVKKLKQPNKNRITWSIEDVAKDIVIHSAGARAYRLLLNKGYPLPAVSTFRSWCKKIKLEPGVLKQVCMIIKRTDLADLQKVCVLSFDELKVRSVYLYEKHVTIYASELTALALMIKIREPVY